MEHRLQDPWEIGNHGVWHLLSYIGLVGSNLVFILPAVRAFEMRFYTRSFLYAAVVVISSFYHLCKPEDGLCILPFSILHFLDFTVSLTAVMSNLLFLLPFVRPVESTYAKKRQEPYPSPPMSSVGTRPLPTSWLYHSYDHARYHHHQQQHQHHQNGLGAKVSTEKVEPAIAKGKHSVRRAVRYDKRFVDTFILLLNAFAIGINVALARGGDPDIKVTLGLVGINLFAVFTTWIVLWRSRGLVPHLDWRDFAVAIFISLLSVALFIGMDYLPSYWIFHSIWHTFAALGSFYLLESRCHVHQGLSQENIVIF